MFVANFYSKFISLFIVFILAREIQCFSWENIILIHLNSIFFENQNDVCPWGWVDSPFRENAEDAELHDVCY